VGSAPAAGSAPGSRERRRPAARECRCAGLSEADDPARQHHTHTHTNTHTHTHTYTHVTRHAAPGGAAALCARHSGARRGTRASGGRGGGRARARVARQLERPVWRSPAQAAAPAPPPPSHRQVTALLQARSPNAKRHFDTSRNGHGTPPRTKIMVAGSAGASWQNRRRWLWLLGTGAAAAGGAYMLYRAWCVTPWRGVRHATAFVQSRRPALVPSPLTSAPAPRAAGRRSSGRRTRRRAKAGALPHCPDHVPDLPCGAPCALCGVPAQARLLLHYQQCCRGFPPRVGHVRAASAVLEASSLYRCMSAPPALCGRHPRHASHARARADVLRCLWRSSCYLSPIRPAPSHQRLDGQGSPSPTPADAMVQSLLTQEALLTPLKQKESHYTRLLAEHAAQVRDARGSSLQYCLHACAIRASTHALRCVLEITPPPLPPFSRILRPEITVSVFITLAPLVFPGAAGTHTGGRGGTVPPAVCHRARTHEHARD